MYIFFTEKNKIKHLVQSSLFDAVMYTLKILWFLFSICDLGRVDSTPKFRLAYNSHMVFVGYIIWFSDEPVTLLEWCEGSKIHWDETDTGIPPLYTELEGTYTQWVRKKGQNQSRNESWTLNRTVGCKPEQPEPPRTSFMWLDKSPLQIWVKILLSATNTHHLWLLGTLITYIIFS